MTISKNKAVLLLFILQLALWPCNALSSKYGHQEEKRMLEEEAQSLTSSAETMLRGGDGGGRESGNVISALFSKNCPPEGFDARKTLDLDSYISEPWYPQKAAPVIYAMDQSYCSVAIYSKDTSCTKFCDDLPRITVMNRGREDSITGDVNTPADIPAFVPDPENNPAKIRVSPPQRFTKITNYWVVAAGTYDDIIKGIDYNPDDETYQWALISGAEPFRESNGKCAPGFGKFDTRGLWIFARDPIPPSDAIDAIEALAEDMGLDTSIMIPVIHDDDCNYQEYCDRC